MSKEILLSGNRFINAKVENAFKKLIEPAEQLKGNTLYLEASYEPKGEIKNGTIMIGKFKGSGKATVIFQNVLPNRVYTLFQNENIQSYTYWGVSSCIQSSLQRWPNTIYADRFF